MTVSHPPGGRLPLLIARPTVTSPAAEHHRPLAGTKLYCLLTEAHRCEQLAKVVLTYLLIIERCCVMSDTMQVRPYPSDEQLQDKLQRHVDWLRYRANVVRQSLAGSSRRHAHQLLVPPTGDVVGHRPVMTSQMRGAAAAD